MHSISGQKEGPVRTCGNKCGLQKRPFSPVKTSACFIVKGLLLLSREIKKDRINSQVWGWRLSEELRGFFGPAYRDKVVMTIDREAKRRQAASQVAAFDRLAQVPPARLQALLQETEIGRAHV